jgi:hypothetical protein
MVRIAERPVLTLISVEGRTTVDKGGIFSPVIGQALFIFSREYRQIDLLTF